MHHQQLRKPDVALCQILFCLRLKVERAIGCTHLSRSMSNIHLEDLHQAAAAVSFAAAENFLRGGTTIPQDTPIPCLTPTLPKFQELLIGSICLDGHIPKAHRPVLVTAP